MNNDIGPFSTATELLAALDRGVVSSRELVESQLARIDDRNAPLNAIVNHTAERAREAARAADGARARGERSPLLGLPMTLKESTQVAGLPQTAGLEHLRDYRPGADGKVAAAVFRAGACLVGTTNIAVGLGDWQTDNPIYGRSNNPWDLERTPGGSTGGGAAALAAGLTPLEVGSDIGGSIRVPAAYCGLYGHRPSETAVPRNGSFPRYDAYNPGALLGVQGPLARSAIDLELLFDVIAGAVDGEDVAWRLELPPARHDRLADFRVAIMPPLSLVQPSAAMTTAVDEVASFLTSAGATVSTAMPELDHDRYFADFLTMLTVMTSRGRTRSDRERTADTLRNSGSPVDLAAATGLTMDGTELLALFSRRESARGAWRSFFADFDVLVCPTVLDAAFPHDDAPFHTRVLRVDDRDVRYGDNIVYPMWAVYAGQPATAFPAGLDAGGLPIGLQAIGPYLEDRTTLRFAQLLERDWRGFEPPPGY